MQSPSQFSQSFADSNTWLLTAENKIRVVFLPMHERNVK
jgi:hypothetical protein